MAWLSMGLDGVAGFLTALAGGFGRLMSGSRLNPDGSGSRLNPDG